MISTSITKNSITAIISESGTNKKELYTVNSSHPNWTNILNALKNQNEEEFLKLINIKKSIEKYLKGNIMIENNELYYKNNKVHGFVVERILEFMRENLPFEPLINFLEKLMQNPSKRAVDELYRFLENRSMPLTPDGNFLAYKKVTKDFWSISRGSLTLLKGKENKEGQVYNGVGEEIECPRNEVCDDKEIGCAQGFHAGSLSYARSFSSSDGKMVIVEINPADVVSVPNDCNCQKLRTCHYKVVGEYTKQLDDNYDDSYHNNSTEDEEYDEYYEYLDDEDDDYED